MILRTYGVFAPRACSTRPLATNLWKSLQIEVCPFTSIGLRQSRVNLVAVLEALDILPDLLDHTRAIVSDLVREPTFAHQHSILSLGEDDRTYSSLTAIFSAPDAFFTSIGLMLAA